MILVLMVDPTPAQRVEGIAIDIALLALLLVAVGPAHQR
jgi:hypothetical protein